MKRIPAIALALLMLLQIFPAAAETPVASGWQQVVSDSVTLSKSTTPFDYSDAGAYVRGIFLFQYCPCTALKFFG